MIRKTSLPEQIVLPCGAILKPVIGGHLELKPFLTVEHSGVDVTKNGWGTALLALGPDVNQSERKLYILEAQRRKLKYRVVSVLSRRLRNALDLHHRRYQPTIWVFVQTN